MRKRGNDAAKLSVVNDVLGSIWSQNVVDGDGVEALRHASQI